jgi:hypothetical protein
MAARKKGKRNQRTPKMRDGLTKERVLEIKDMIRNGEAKVAAVVTISEQLDQLTKTTGTVTVAEIVDIADARKERLAAALAAGNYEHPYVRDRIIELLHQGGERIERIEGTVCGGQPAQSDLDIDVDSLADAIEWAEKLGPEEGCEFSSRQRAAEAASFYKLLLLVRARLKARAECCPEAS